DRRPSPRESAGLVTAQPQELEAHPMQQPSAPSARPPYPGSPLPTIQKSGRMNDVGARLKFHPSAKPMGSRAMSCLGERVPSRRVRCAVLFQSDALPSEALRIQRRAITDVLESQRLGQEPLLQRAADRAFDIRPIARRPSGYGSSPKSAVCSYRSEPGK